MNFQIFATVQSHDQQKYNLQLTKLTCTFNTLQIVNPFTSGDIAAEILMQEQASYMSQFH